jgi:hypothetical protein
VQCDTLRAALLGLAYYFAQACFGVLKAPAVARGVARLGRFFHFHLDSLSSLPDYNNV